MAFRPLLPRALFLASLACATGCSDDDFGSARPSQDAAAPGQDDLATVRDLSVPLDTGDSAVARDGAADGATADGGTAD